MVKGGGTQVVPVSLCELRDRGESLGKTGLVDFAGQNTREMLFDLNLICKTIKDLGENRKSS